MRPLWFLLGTAWLAQACEHDVVTQGPLPELTSHTVILFIGDGMGAAAIEAAGDYAYGGAGMLAFESLPYRGDVATASLGGEITDSAAAATAMATGVAVDNGVISVAVPGDGAPLVTVLELFAAAGRATGLVTTTDITHATPAAFAAHEPSRANQDEIGQDYFAGARPQVLFGGGGHVTPAQAETAGYLVVQTRAELLAATTATTERVSGQFGSGDLPYEADGLGELPHLAEMTAAALTLLERSRDGFFLMVEGGRIDHAGHANDLLRSVHEVIELSHAVQVALAWAAGRGDTLLLVTADHETGGLAVHTNHGAGQLPDVSWAGTAHTGVDVPVFAWGPGAEAVSGQLDNTALFTLMVTSGRAQP